MGKYIDVMIGDRVRVAHTYPGKKHPELSGDFVIKSFVVQEMNGGFPASIDVVFEGDSHPQISRRYAAEYANCEDGYIFSVGLLRMFKHPLSGRRRTLSLLN